MLVFGGGILFLSSLALVAWLVGSSWKVALKLP